MFSQAHSIDIQDKAMDEIRIIIIEDHDLTRLGLTAALQRKEGIRVVGEAANATQGLKLFETFHPDVAIVDIGLPDMDGIELVRKYRQSHAPVEEGAEAEAETESAPLTRILMLTMHRTPEDVLAAFAAGADSYCMKNINVEMLQEAIRATHEGNPWIDPAIANIVLQQVRQSVVDTQAATARKTVNISAAEPEYQEVAENAMLTERELEILKLIVSGGSNADIAEQLYITVGTVKTHVRNILSKLCADDRTQAAVLALRSGLIS
jgi:DNA-binding NarL/FixJ family response regulator